MPNTIKYSTGPVTRALRVGNFYLGVGDEGKGPTNETGFWNGFSTGTFSYIIYQNKQDNGPIIYPIQNDTELIERTNYIDSSVVRTTKEECFSYFAGQSDKMVVNKDYEAIVTDGLLLLYDSNFLPSYPSNSTIWYSLGSLQQNASLENGPIFNSNGWIEFDGTNDYIKITSTSSISFQPNQNFSLFCIFNVKSISGTTNVIDNTGVIFGQGFTTGSFGIGANYNQITNSYNFRIGVRTTSNTIIEAADNTLVLNVIYNVGFSYSPTSIKIYINGVLKNTISTTGISNLSFSSSDYHIYRNYPLPGGNGRWLNGNVYGCSIYNKSLSDQEVLQNYYQGPIVTDGLVFSFDSSNIISYPFTGTTAYSLTGSNTLTLANGVGFDKKYGGRWTFDGSNDRLDSNFTDVIDSVTIECWYRGTKTTRNHLWNFGLAPTTNFHCNFNDSGIPLWFYWNGNGSPRLWFTQGNFTDGTIKQLVFTHQGSDNQAYLNGQLLTAGRATAGTQTFNNVNSGGTFNLGGSVAFGGDIYQVKIYNRALSASEILQNFNAHRSRFGI